VSGPHNLQPGQARPGPVDGGLGGSRDEGDLHHGQAPGVSLCRQPAGGRLADWCRAQGGFTLWPSKHTPYGVQAATRFRGGKGDVLKEFVAAAKRWNIGVCYYINPLDDGYLSQIANVSAPEFEARQKGMLTELLAPGSPYGPVPTAPHHSHDQKRSRWMTENCQCLAIQALILAARRRRSTVFGSMALATVSSSRASHRYHDRHPRYQCTP
jgi:hypothetical protein